MFTWNVNCTAAYKSLGTKRITAKISTENKGSIQLFLTQLGFVQIGYSEIFGEVTLERVLPALEATSTEGGQVAKAADAVSAAVESSVTQAQFETLHLDAGDVDS